MIKVGNYLENFFFGSAMEHILFGFEITDELETMGVGPMFRPLQVHKNFATESEEQTFAVFP